MDGRTVMNLKRSNKVSIHPGLLCMQEESCSILSRWHLRWIRSRDGAEGAERVKRVNGAPLRWTDMTRHTEQNKTSDKIPTLLDLLYSLHVVFADWRSEFLFAPEENSHLDKILATEDPVICLLISFCIDLFFNKTFYISSQSEMSF